MSKKNCTTRLNWGEGGGGNLGNARKKSIFFWELFPKLNIEVNFYTKLPLTGCPDGYAYHAGDIPGWGSLSSHNSIDDIASCAEQCDGTPACCSFEYNPTGKICNLNEECRPSTGPVEGVAFCVKGKTLLCTIWFLKMCK